MDARPRRLKRRTTPTTGGVREDCWSEGETGALVEAWGDRYVQLKRGNLRQKDWQDVADSVNEHQDALGRPRRTDVQCKNRIDTLKKKYKIEKARRRPSDWLFFSRLDDLIGSSSPTHASGTGNGTLRKHQTPKTEPHRVSERPSLSLKAKDRPGSNHKPSLRSSMNFCPRSSESSHGETGDGVGNGNNDVSTDENEDEDDRNKFLLSEVPIPNKRKWDGFVKGGGGAGGDSGGDSGTEDEFGELAKAILKLGEIYERVESLKQQHLIQMERQRMELAKELEFQWMRIFMETQLELEKMKRPKYSSNDG